jgi:hypothetical protein
VLQESPRTVFLGGNLQCRDLDNDGDLDLMVADVDIDIGICETSPDDPRKFALLRNEEVASGNLVDPWGLETNPWNTNVFDFAVLDLDGKLDFFLATCDGYSVWMQEPTLHVSSAAIAFEGTIAGTVEQQTLRVCNNGDQPIAISDISTTDNHFTVDVTAFTLEPFECRDVTVSFAPPESGNYAATLSLTGDLSRDVALGGSALTPPVALLETNVLNATLNEGEKLTKSVNFSNPGGSPLQYEIQVTDPNAAPDRILLMGDSIAVSLVEGILQDTPNEFATADISALTEASLENYETLMIAMVSGSVSSESMAVLTAAVRSGKTLVIFGASTSSGFLDALQADLLSYVDEPGWKEPLSPHFSVVDLNHPLSDGLPMTNNFSSTSASWYRIQPNDPAAWVAAENGDGIPCLLSKRVGSGSLIYFINWPLSFVWDNPVDLPFFESVVANAIGFAKTAWLSVKPRSGVLPAGAQIDIDVTFNAIGLAPGAYDADIVFLTNDQTRDGLHIDATLVITSELRLEFVSMENDVVTLSLSGEPGITFDIQQSGNLTDWESSGSVVATQGSQMITRTLDSEAEAIFFRAVELE